MEAVLQQLDALPENEAIDAIISALRNRPELAPAVVVAACPDLTYAPAKAATERREVGFIKSFNQKNGYGFIESPEVREIFNQDAFLHKRQMGMFMVGQQVSFAVMLNEDNKPQAFDLQPVGSPPMAAMPMPMPGHMPGMGMPHPGPFPGHGHPALPMGPPGPWPHEAAGRRFRGVLKSFKASSGFGFIDCRETRDIYGRDVFVHKDEVRDTEVGSRVSFALSLNNKGQPQAKGMKVLVPSEANNSSAPQSGKRPPPVPSSRPVKRPRL